jgi:hypothetical protein
MLTFPNDDESITREAVLRSELKTLTEEQIEMDLFRDYFDGEQPLVYSTELFHDIFGDAFEGFKDNWMKVIINACNSRIRLLNFHFEDDEDSELSSQIWDVLRLNEINVQQKDLHEGAMIEGRAFVVVWPDPDFGAIVDWQPGQICRVFYNPDKRTEALWAVKRWVVDTGDIYVTFYTPEFVYKFRDTSVGQTRSTKHSSSSALKEIPEVGWFGNLEERDITGEAWPLPNPFGRVPMVEFNNTSYKSELQDAIPQQDALNKTLLDMMVTGEFQAFAQRVMETNSAAPEGGWRAGPGEVWAIRPSFDADGKQVQTTFHTFETADPSTYMQPIQMWLQHMALTSSTPVRYFMQSDRGGRGDAPSGDSLLVDDKPLNDKVEDKQERWGNRWVEVARLIADALEIEDAFSLVGDAVWQDPRHDFILSKLKEGQAMIEIGIPIEFVVTKLGFTPAEEVEVLVMVEEAKKEQEAKEAAELAASTAALNTNISPTE